MKSDILGSLSSPIPWTKHHLDSKIEKEGNYNKWTSIMGEIYVWAGLGWSFITNHKLSLIEQSFYQLTPPLASFSSYQIPKALSY